MNGPASNPQGPHLGLPGLLGRHRGLLIARSQLFGILRRADDWRQAPPARAILQILPLTSSDTYSAPIRTDRQADGTVRRFGGSRKGAEPENPVANSSKRPAGLAPANGTNATRCPLASVLDHGEPFGTYSATNSSARGSRSRLRNGDSRCRRRAAGVRARELRCEAVLS